MDEITSDQLRRQTSVALDGALKGTPVYVTRNGRRIAVLMPVGQYEQLAGVAVRDLAKHLGSTIPQVSRAVAQMIEQAGSPDGIVLESSQHFGSTVLYAEAAARLFATGIPAQADQ